MTKILIGVLLIVISLDGNSIIHYLLLFGGLIFLVIALKKL